MKSVPGETVWGNLSGLVSILTLASFRQFILGRDLYLLVPCVTTAKQASENFLTYLFFIKGVYE